MPRTQWHCANSRGRKHVRRQSCHGDEHVFQSESRGGIWKALSNGDEDVGIGQVLPELVDMLLCTAQQQQEHV